MVRFEEAGEYIESMRAAHKRDSNQPDLVRHTEMCLHICYSKELSRYSRSMIETDTREEQNVVGLCQTPSFIGYFM